MGNESLRIPSPVTAGPSIPEHLSSLGQGRNQFSAASAIAQILLGPNCRDVACNFSTLPRTLDRLSSSQRRLLEEQTAGHLNEFLSLARETNAELFFETLLHLAGSFVNRGSVEFAGRIYATIAQQLPSPLGGGGQGEGLVDVARQAREYLITLGGQGTFWNQIEFLGRHVAVQSLEPAGLAGMFAAGPASRFFRLFAATQVPRLGIRCLTRRPVLTALSHLIGFSAEISAFTGAARGVNLLFGREQEWSGRALGREFAGGALMLGPLHLTGGLGRRIARRVFSTPGIRSRMGNILLPQLGMFLGILGGHELEELFNLHPDRNADSVFADGISTFFQFRLAGGLMGSLMSTRYRAWNAAWERTIEAEFQSASTSTPRYFDTPTWPDSSLTLHPTPHGLRSTLLAIRSLLLSPLFLMMGAIGEGGGGRMAPPRPGKPSGEPETTPSPEPSSTQLLSYAEPPSSIPNTVRARVNRLFDLIGTQLDQWIHRPDELISMGRAASRDFNMNVRDIHVAFIKNSQRMSFLLDAMGNQTKAAEFRQRTENFCRLSGMRHVDSYTFRGPGLTHTIPLGGGRPQELNQLIRQGDWNQLLDRIENDPYLFAHPYFMSELINSPEFRDYLNTLENPSARSE